MKVGDASYGKKISFNVQDSIGDQLENLISMVYNMSIQKEEGKKPFKPQVYSKGVRGQRRQNFDGRDRSFKIVDRDKALDRHKTDEDTVIEGELIDKISAEMIVEIEVDKISEETLAMIEID